MRRLLQGGSIVSEQGIFTADLLIEAGKIAAIGPELKAPDAEIVDATGRLLLPGGVDQHVHFSYTYRGQTVRGWEISAAAIAGGVTTIADFANNRPELGLLESITAYEQEQIAGRACCDHVLHAGMKQLRDEDIAAISRLPELGIASLNVALSQSGSADFCDDRQLFRIFSLAAEQGLTCFVHGENQDIAEELTAQLLAEGKSAVRYFPASRPPLLELESTHRAAAIAALTGAKCMITHVSLGEAAAIIRHWREQGALVYGETCPQYLLLDESLLQQDGLEGAKYLCTPALRERGQQELLWQALADGTLQTVATDHCSFDFAEQKALARDGFHLTPRGLPGLQERMLLLWSYGVRQGRISAADMVRLCCANPARALGIYPQKGVLAVGSDADIVLLDPDRPGVIRSSEQLYGIDYSAYEGMAIEGAIEQVLLRGETVYRQGAYCGTVGGGQRIKATAARNNIL